MSSRSSLWVKVVEEDVGNDLLAHRLDRLDMDFLTG